MKTSTSQVGGKGKGQGKQKQSHAAATLDPMTIKGPYIVITPDRMLVGQAEITLEIEELSLVVKLCDAMKRNVSALQDNGGAR